MLLIRQLGIIIGICFLGEFMNKLLGIPIPANVLGMLLLLVFLIFGLIKEDHIDKISQFLLDHLAFIFVPAGVSILNNIKLIRDQWLPIVLTILLSTIIVMAVTGLTVQFLIRRKST